jgi:DNA-binding response OmpR family regulator
MVREAILLLEHDVEAEQLLTEVLTRAGFEVFAAAKPAAVLKALRATGFPMVLLDGQFPDVDALAYVHQVKQVRPRTDVVVMASGWSPAAIAAVLRAGASDVIAKPFDATEFAMRIRAKVDRKLREIERARQFRSQALPAVAPPPDAPPGMPLLQPAVEPLPPLPAPPPAPPAPPAVPNVAPPPDADLEFAPPGAVVPVEPSSENLVARPRPTEQELLDEAVSLAEQVLTVVLDLERQNLSLRRRVHDLENPEPGELSRRPLRAVVGLDDAALVEQLQGQAGALGLELMAPRTLAGDLLDAAAGEGVDLAILGAAFPDMPLERVLRTLRTQQPHLVLVLIRDWRTSSSLGELHAADGLGVVTSRLGSSEALSDLIERARSRVVEADLGRAFEQVVRRRHDALGHRLTALRAALEPR